MSNLLFEYLIRIEADEFVCRIWAKEDVPSVSDLRGLAKAILKSKIPAMDMLEAIGKLPHVNSAEILDRTGLSGMCIHVDWP